ncbi:hypothetical protein BBK36DRAFT_1174988 [Trichoderma citrinoviride]|uniref:Uncharacterized protein n=1 Tax=Trichoderma citrinoviride TaxID=58853 RepID=A0A2T4BMT7_9HYPO|nr:hypothetical protein BBK36DRAFT_1174988 [Trichoderma citrinoviride]PTB70637.1 hypothetical protein BBK36DRAFT_1174988 [Trichoderma citrinoviride]
MPPHVLVRAAHSKEQEQETLPAPLLSFFFCLAFLVLVSHLANYLEAYKRRLVKFLLLPLETPPDHHDGPGDDEQLYCHFSEKDFDRVLPVHRFHYAPRTGDNPFADMSASQYALDSDKRILYHAQVTLGCNGLRDLFSLGFMRQDTLERRINAAGKKIILNSIVSVSAVWLREKICRAYSAPTMVLPSLKELCLFLDGKGCSRDMCCQIFYEAFQKADPNHADKIALPVGSIVLTSFRAVVDHLYDHWQQWLLEAAGPKQTPEKKVPAIETSGHFPAPKEVQQKAKDGKLPYPAYNHELVRMSADEYNLRLQAGLEQLHKDQEPPPSHRNGSVFHGNRAPIGHCPPYDIGRASSWGSQPDQSERCVTRLQDCVCKSCHVKGWLSRIPKGGAEDQDLNTGTLGHPVNENENLAMTAKRAALLAKIDRLTKRHRDPFFSETDSEDERTQDPEPLVFGPKLPQVSHPEHDGNGGKESKGAESAFSCDLICFDKDGIGVGEVDHFLADVEVSPAGGDQSPATAPEVEGGSHNEERLGEEPDMEVSLLDGSPQKGNIQSLPSGLTADIQIGCIKPMRRDPPYGPVVHDLFYARDNVWVQQVKRSTALEMWDVTENSDSKDGDQPST